MEQCSCVIGHWSWVLSSGMIFCRVWPSFIIAFWEQAAFCLNCVENQCQSCEYLTNIHPPGKRLLWHILFVYSNTRMQSCFFPISVHSMAQLHETNLYTGVEYGKHSSQPVMILLWHMRTWLLKVMTDFVAHCFILFVRHVQTKLQRGHLYSHETATA